MSYSKKNSELMYEVEILKVKLDQMEKRFNLLEKTITLLENSLRSEININQNTHITRSKDTDFSSSEDDASSDEEIAEKTNKQPNFLRRTIS